ncbi:TetR family transcriptional regulator [Kribbella sp. HUAS MG21]|uniref:TetR family transcriptional regulator n=1 Tax=Kribbella sp. HUAS MG21 TaxID=3160966 RepID=A0AAU7T5E5_9ACTN
MSGTPDRILAAARTLFVERGYRATSMQAIADEVGITKAALYYHFAAKDDILRRLTLPLLDELERTLADAEKAGDPETVRWTAIEGYVDVYLKHRQTLVMLIRDMTLLVEAPVASRFVAAIALANDLVAGPTPTLEARVRASQVVAALGDPIALFRDLPPTHLKHLILTGAQALLQAAPPPAGSLYDATLGRAPHKASRGPTSAVGLGKPDLDSSEAADSRGAGATAHGETSRGEASDDGPPASGGATYDATPPEPTYHAGSGGSAYDVPSGRRAHGLGAAYGVAVGEAGSRATGRGDGEAAGRASSGEGSRGLPRGRGGGRPAVLGEVGVARARELYAAGRPVAEIAADLGVSRATVYRCLKN